MKRLELFSLLPDSTAGIDLARTNGLSSRKALGTRALGGTFFNPQLQLIMNIVTTLRSRINEL